MSLEPASTTRTCAEHRVDGVPMTTETLVGSRHRRDRGLSDTPRRPRRGPKQLPIEKGNHPRHRDGRRERT